MTRSPRRVGAPTFLGEGEFRSWTGSSVKGPNLSVCLINHLSPSAGCFKGDNEGYPLDDTELTAASMAAMATPVPPPPPAGLDPTIRMRTASFARIAALGLIVATPVATWKLVGPNPGNELGSNPTLRPDNYDYMFHPPVIDPSIERVVGVGALIVVIAAVGAIVVAARSGLIDRRWWAPIIATCVAGAIAGMAERVMTAAVDGANIGGGLMVLFGTPVILVLLLGSMLRSIHILRTTHLPGDG